MSLIGVFGGRAEMGGFTVYSRSARIWRCCSGCAVMRLYYASYPWDRRGGEQAGLEIHIDILCRYADAITLRRYFRGQRQGAG